MDNLHRVALRRIGIAFGVCVLLSAQIAFLYYWFLLAGDMAIQGKGTLANFMGLAGVTWVLTAVIMTFVIADNVDDIKRCRKLDKNSYTYHDVCKKFM